MVIINHLNVILNNANIYIYILLLVPLSNSVEGSDITRKTVTHAYVMAPTKSRTEKKRPIWKYAFYACLVILGSIIGVVAYVTYSRGL